MNHNKNILLTKELGAFYVITKWCECHILYFCDMSSN